MLSVPHPLHLLSFNDCLLHTQYPFFYRAETGVLGNVLKDGMFI